MTAIRSSLVLAACALLGCGTSAPTPAAAKAAPKAAAMASAADAGTIAATAQGYVYTYNPMAKRDPFRSPVAELAAKAEASGACSEPLCQWDLDQLKLVAVVTGEANPLAMVEDPGTRGYVVRRGSRVGKQGGQVTQILRDSITVTEYFQSPDGKRNPSATTMRMKADAQAAAQLDLMSGKNIQ